MYLGFLIGGMVLGLASAGWWIIAGGSLLAAVGVYSLVGTLSVLCAAAVTVAISALRTGHVTETNTTITPAE